MYKIENEFLCVEIDEFGAEMKKITGKTDKKEYLWNGDPAFWGRCAPVLFPFIGKLFHGEYRINGKKYPMTSHGFARDTKFELVSQTQNEIWFQLKSGEKTKAVYPFDFCLKAGYQLREDTIKVKWEVENLSDAEMYFSIGGHPGFYTPVISGQEGQHYALYFENIDKLTSREITKEGLAGNTINEYQLQDHKLMIDEHLFDHDALVLENSQVSKVSLVAPNGKMELTVAMDCPVLGIWAPAGKGVPFVCIEPWYGRCDEENYTGELKNRKWENTINGHEIWSGGFEITISR